MQDQHYFKWQLPPLKQSLSNSSLSTTTNNDSAASPSAASAPPAPLLPPHHQHHLPQSLPDLRRTPVQFPPIDRPQAAATSPVLPRPRGDSADQRSDISNSISSNINNNNNNNNNTNTMYQNYVGQYPSHQQLGQNVYGNLQQQQAQQQGRMMPGAAASQALLPPPVYPQTTYGAPSLPGPLPYDGMQQQSADNHSQQPAVSLQHTLASSVDEARHLSHLIGTRGGYKYELRVEQQPQRARMCGFGDKDRRPITPPPCVRLIVRNLNTDEEVDVDKIDGAFFVLQVDLWNDAATHEVNVIRASSSAPTQSISTAVPMSYPPPAMNSYMDMGYGFGNNVFGQPGFFPPHPPPHNSHVMYTRNLIGSLTVNASLLKDLDGNHGYWFVLSDLSVRTEGWFRLKMAFIDVGAPQGSNGETGLNRARCPILADTFSDKFQVYSAKKFPGVIESTPLSKCFASQGIKIPIRKDGKGDKNDDDD